MNDQWTRLRIATISSAGMPIASRRVAIARLPSPAIHAPPSTTVTQIRNEALNSDPRFSRRMGAAMGGFVTAGADAWVEISAPHRGQNLALGFGNGAAQVGQWDTTLL